MPDSRPQTKLSRRDFVQTLGAAGTALAGLSLARSAHAAGSDTIRIGMVGCGGRCTGAAGEALSVDPGLKLVAMCDLFADRVQGKLQSLQNLKNLAGGQVAVDKDHCFVGLDGYKKVIDSVDVVLIACAAKFHPMYLKAAIEAGKHVFVEKPHAIDPAGVKVVVEACKLAKQKNLGVLSGLQSRFHQPIRETVDRIHDGQIGEVVSIEENFLRSPYGRTQRPAGLRELEVQYGNQYRFSWLCGDDVTQSLIHNLDRSTWVLGEATPVDCHGMGGRSGSQTLLGDVFDHHAVVYRYKNGVRVYALTRTTLGCYNEYTSNVLGTKGVAYTMTGVITGQNPWKFKGPAESPYVREHREFFQSIRAGKPLNCGDYMARSTLVVVMGQLSCYSGREITWEEISKSDYVIPPKPELCTWDMAPPTQPDDRGSYPVCAVPGLTRNI